MRQHWEPAFCEDAPAAEAGAAAPAKTGQMSTEVPERQTLGAGAPTAPTPPRPYLLTLSGGSRAVPDLGLWLEQRSESCRASATDF